MGKYTYEVVSETDLGNGLTMIVRKRDLAMIATTRAQGWAAPMPDCPFVASVLTAQKRIKTYGYGHTIEEAEAKAMSHLPAPA